MTVEGRPAPTTQTGPPRYAVVVIGRNEGERLEACLRSVAGRAVPILYVDSGSSDGSPQLARRAGADVLELDPARKFSAARARNEGFDRLLARHPELAYVQFVDGDCEVFLGWLDRAVAALDAQPEVLAVAGHVQERLPHDSIYKRLCAIEWRKTPGEIAACGGIFMVRTAAFRAAGGFRPEVIAGEESEFCSRLRATGGTIVHLDHDMVWHEIGMTRFSQWWKRARRAGHAYAQVASLQAGQPDRHFQREVRSAQFWGMALPAAALALAWPTRGVSLTLLAAYPVLAARIYRWGRRTGLFAGDAALYAFFVVLAKFPEAAGVLEYYRRRWRREEMSIIEHKGAGAP